MKVNKETVSELIDAEYEKAKALPYIKKPMAYAVYQVWKMIDKNEKERNTDEET